MQHSLQFPIHAPFSVLFILMTFIFLCSIYCCQSVSSIFRPSEKVFRFIFNTTFPITIAGHNKWQETLFMVSYRKKQPDHTHCLTHSLVRSLTNNAEKPQHQQRNALSNYCPACKWKKNCLVSFNENGEHCLWQNRQKELNKKRKITLTSYSHDMSCHWCSLYELERK